MTRLLRRGLEHAGYSVITMSDGRAALRHIRKSPPDILITDADIQPMSGEELCQRLQSEMPERQFLTCVMTSSADDEYHRWASWFANFRILEKPVSMRNLLAYIEQHLADRAA